ncbi:hypothetical protein PVAP13_5KG083287 [Panicum virgatum]|uniref:Transposase MuDR plant domain-containing protein n=1 Tax=Panicum virgatum TaxID=38727 RepID=A0A8T0SET1_PANVG|nr:hypothetical protein PVAP13_5KG083287 [Panicum virgatum]
MRGPWFAFNKVVDSDTTNFKDLVDEIVDQFPCGYGDVVKLFYFCAASKSNIEIHSDHDLMNMFKKHMSSKYCCMSIAYHKPDVDPPKIPLWDNVEMTCTPLMSAPSYVESSKAIQSGTVTKPDYDMVEDNKFMNPEPQNEYVGVDEEGLYIDIAPTSHANVDTSEKKDEDYDPGSNSESESDSESDMDAEVDEIIKDTLPSHISEVAYNKDDPPIEVKKNPFPHSCHSTRRIGKVKGATKFWICERIKDWLAEDKNIGPTELQRRLKEHYKVSISYKRVYVALGAEF